MQKGFRVKNRICILGSSSIYTKIICKELDDRGIEYFLILEKTAVEHKKYFSKLCTIFLKLDKLLNSGKYKALPKLNFFTLNMIIQDFIFKRSSKYKIIIDPFINYKPKTENIYYVKNVNHVTTSKLIENLNCDIGIFGGVGIVDGLIIEKFNRFCLNAHPAPLPECRGGGALENTLNYGLQPSASVHFGTARIDEGKIIKIKELKIEKDDTFNSISTRLTILCAVLLTEVIVSINNDEELDLKENNGKLHYWKDCNIDIQKNARKNLKKLLSKLN